MIQEKLGMNNNPLPLLDELTIADDLMEYSELEFTMFLLTNTGPLSNFVPGSDE